MTSQEIMDLIAKAKQLGLKSLKIGEMELEFHADTPIQTHTIDSGASSKPVNEEIPDLEANEIVAPPSRFDRLTDEEILFWSSAYGEELEREKARHESEELIRKAHAGEVE